MRPNTSPHSLLTTHDSPERDAIGRKPSNTMWRARGGGPLGAGERAVPPHGSRGWLPRVLSTHKLEARAAYDIWRLTSFVISNMLT